MYFPERSGLSLKFKYFIVGSLAAHLILLGLMQWLPQKVAPPREEKPLIAKLVTPEDLGNLLRRKRPEPERPPLPPELPSEKPLRPLPQEPKHRIKPLEPPPKTMEDRGKGPGTETKQEEPAKPKRKGDDDQSTFREELKVAEKKAIEKIVEESEEGKKSETGNGSDDAITFTTKEFKYYGYKTRLKEKIEGIWKYPREAAEKGIYGDLIIQFTILRDGTLGAVELQRTSGYKMLDDAAVQALRDAAPFWPLPKEWKEKTFTIRGHFIYTLGGYYLR